MFNLENIISLIPLTIIVSIVIFVVKLFGRITSDQVPFADSRSWHEELSGLLFFVNWVISPSVFAYIIYSEGFNLIFKIENLFLFVAWILVIINMSILRRMVQKFFEDDYSYEKDIVKITESFKDESKIRAAFSLYLKYASLLLTPIILIVLFFYFIKWNIGFNYYISLGIYIFFSFIYVAIVLSLKGGNINFVNIKLNSGDEIKKCRLLKVNKDNVRVKSDNDIIIINKNEVLLINYLKNGDSLME